MIKNSFGFTLVELLVSIAIVITSATVVVAIITASFRGSAQTSINEQLRLEGNSAISQISKMIQFADAFEGVVDGSEVVDNTAVEYGSCVSNDEGATFSDLRLNIDGSTTTISCKDSTVQINSVSIFDSANLVVDNCAITCSQTNTTDSPVVGIEFDLSRNDSTQLEQRASMHFEKKIKMRNFSQ